MWQMHMDWHFLNVEDLTLHVKLKWMEMSGWIASVNIFTCKLNNYWIKQYFADGEIEMKEYDQKYQNATIGRNPILLLPSFYTSNHFKVCETALFKQWLFVNKMERNHIDCSKYLSVQLCKGSRYYFRRKRHWSSLYHVFYKKYVSSPFLPKKRMTSNQNDFQEKEPFIYFHFFFFGNYRTIFLRKNLLYFLYFFTKFLPKTIKTDSITRHLI